MTHKNLNNWGTPHRKCKRCIYFTRYFALENRKDIYPHTNKNVLERRKCFTTTKSQKDLHETTLFFLPCPSSPIQVQCESNLFWTWEVCLKTNALFFLHSLLTSLFLKTRWIQWLVNTLLEKISLNSRACSVLCSGIGFSVFLFMLAMNWFFYYPGILRDPELSLAAKTWWLLNDSNSLSFHCQTCF